MSGSENKRHRIVSDTTPDTEAQLDPSNTSNTFGSPFNISSFFLWNMSPAGVVPNGSHFYLYLPNVHENVVTYYCSSSFKTW